MFDAHQAGHYLDLAPISLACHNCTAGLWLLPDVCFLRACGTMCHGYHQRLKVWSDTMEERSNTCQSHMLLLLRIQSGATTHAAWSGAFH